MAALALTIGNGARGGVQQARSDPNQRQRLVPGAVQYGQATSVIAQRQLCQIGWLWRSAVPFELLQETAACLTQSTHMHSRVG